MKGEARISRLERRRRLESKDPWTKELLSILRKARTGGPPPPEWAAEFSVERMERDGAGAPNQQA